MPFTPVYALHKDSDGNVLDATSTEYSFELEKWFRSIDPRPGDTITFGEKLNRREAPANVEQLAIVKAEKAKA